MDRKIPWLKIAVAAAVVATTAVGIALFIKKKLDELKFNDDYYDYFDDECEFYDSYNPMDEVISEDYDKEQITKEDKEIASTKTNMEFDELSKDIDEIYNEEKDF